MNHLGSGFLKEEIIRQPEIQEEIIRQPEIQEKNIR